MKPNSILVDVFITLTQILKSVGKKNNQNLNQKNITIAAIPFMLLTACKRKRAHCKVGAKMIWQKDITMTPVGFEPTP